MSTTRATEPKAPIYEVVEDEDDPSMTVAPEPQPQSSEQDSSRPVPPDFIVHRESTTSILFAAPPPSSSSTHSTAPVFLNPVQEYNRDLSVVAIRTWSERRQHEKRDYWEVGVRRKWARKGSAAKAKGGPPEHESEVDAATKQDGGQTKKRKIEDGSAVNVQTPIADTNGSAASTEPERVLRYPTFKFNLLEALSATGLRAIRYAKEIPLLKYVVANDLSSSAIVDIRRNVEWNGLNPKGVPEEEEEQDTKRTKEELEELTLGKVRVNEGDACVYMYQHRAESARFDCVDLDPYGSAVPFLDAAIGAVADGGLLCITCTDMGVLAGHNYPEKAFTHYGGTCVNAEYSHEVALRLVLHSIATTAARYGRYIEPLLSLSIDFYVRLFIRVNTGPKEVKALPTKTSLLYYCHSCQSPHFQPFGKMTEKASAKTGALNPTYHSPSGPPPGVGANCEQCGGRFHIGGPMWSGPLHDPSFVESMLQHVQTHSSQFKTASRIEGMLTIAKSELPDAPLYFTPTKVCGFFHCQSPPLNLFASALLNAGYSVSRSHAYAGSLKTSAPREFVFDIVREWIKTNPVEMKHVKEGSPTRRLLDREQKYEIDLTPHPDASKRMLSDLKLVRYQMNPQANWGPAKAAIRGAGVGGKKE